MRTLGAIVLVAAAVCFAAWRMVRPPAETAAESVRPTWTGARLEETRGLTVMKLAGSPREKGVGHGSRLAGRIRALFDAVKPSDPGLADFAIRTCARQIAPRLPGEYRDEIEGIAQGAGLMFEEVLFLNTRFELRAFALAGGTNDGIGFGGAAATGKGPEVVRIFRDADLDGRARDLVVFVHLDDTPLVLVGLPGMVGGFLGTRGIEQRVAAALRPVQGAPTPVLTGLPWPLLVRRLLEQPPLAGVALPAQVTLDASVAYIRADGEAGTLDVSPRGATWHPAGGAYAVARPEALSGDGAVVVEAELDPARQLLGRERSRRVMAGTPLAQEVEVRLHAGPEGVRVLVSRDGVRFARSIRFRD